MNTASRFCDGVLVRFANRSFSSLLLILVCMQLVMPFRVSAQPDSTEPMQQEMVMPEGSDTAVPVANDCL